MAQNLKPYALAAWTALVLFLTLMPSPGFGASGPAHYDKAGHFFLFGIFVYLLQGNIRAVPAKKAAVSALAGALFALMIEFLQNFIPGRSPDHWDLLAGAAGIAAFAAIAYAREKK